MNEPNSNNPAANGIPAEVEASANSHLDCKTTNIMWYE